VDASPDAKPTAGTKPEIAGRLRSIAKIVVIDVAAPLIVYSLLRSAGMSTVTALVLSGVFPALGVAIGVIQHRRLDIVGALVLAGILAGTVLGLISHNARLVLMEASVPTAIFGLGCLGSLWTRRPLMYGLAVEFIGPDTAKGREMIGLWQYEGFRRIFRVITAVWGVGFLLEAALAAHRRLGPRGGDLAGPGAGRAADHDRAGQDDGLGLGRRSPGRYHHETGTSPVPFTPDTRTPPRPARWPPCAYAPRPLNQMPGHAAASIAAPAY
jgi:hypothetical protein